MDSAKVQEAASTFAGIGFDANRLEELSFGEFDTFTAGVVELLEEVNRKLSMRSTLLVAHCTKETTVENIMYMMQSLLCEKAVVDALNRYRPNAPEPD